MDGDKQAWFVKEYLQTAKTYTFCGIKLEDMSREELMSSIIIALDIAKCERKELRRRTNFLLGAE